MALGLKPAALNEVLSILTEELAPIDKRREFDRKRKLAGTNGHKIETVEIRYGTPQWDAWEKYRGKPIPRGMSMVWQVTSEWPPGQMPESEVGR